MDAWRTWGDSEAVRVLEAMGDGVLVVDEEEICRFANSALLSYLDIPWEMGQAVPLARFLERVPALRLSWEERLRRVRKEQGPLRGEDAFCRGIQPFCCETLFSPVPNNGVPCVVVVCRDTSDRWRESEALRAARDAAEEAVRRKGRFLAHMSHEIRTPMHAVLGLSELLLDTPLSTEQGEFVRIMHESSESLLTLLNDVLDYSKLEAERLVLEHRPFCIRRVVDAAVSLVAQEARRKGLVLGVRVDERVPECVEGDAVRLRQILVNLLGNAVKFTSQGEVRLEVAFDAEQTPPRLWASVRDTGIGIPADRLGELFESFHQLDVSMPRRYGGTGLGLAISRRLVELLGGSLSVESSGAGQGSTFRFFVAAPPASSEREEDMSSEAYGPFDRTLGERHPLKILLVDDDVVNRKVGGHMLRHLGYVPDAVFSGEDALRTLRERAYDVILMDVQMPGMGGVEAVRRLATMGFPLGRPRVVAMTAQWSPQMRQWCREAGVDDFLRKPVRGRELREVLLRCAAARESFSAPDLQGQTETPARDERDGIPFSLVDTQVLGRLLVDLGEGALEDLRDVVRAYLRHSPDVLAGMKEAASQGDRDRLERGAHTLKSTSDALGALRFASLCRELEAACQSALPSDVSERVERLCRIFDGTALALQEAMETLAHR